LRDVLQVILPYMVPHTQTHTVQEQCSIKGPQQCEVCFQAVQCASTMFHFYWYIIPLFIIINIGSVWSEHATKLQIWTWWFCTVASTYSVLPECHSLRVKTTNILKCVRWFWHYLFCAFWQLHCSFMTPTNASLIYVLQTQSYIAPTCFSVTPSAILTQNSLHIQKGSKIN
jgi:hypothetical protein